MAVMTMNRLSDKQWMVLVVGLGLLLRLLLLSEFHHYYYFSGISLEHGVSALQITRGQGFQSLVEITDEVAQSQIEQHRLIDPYEYPDFKDAITAQQPTLAYPPGYAMLLAFFFKLFGSARFIWVQILQVLLDAVACAVLFLAINRMLEDRVARLASLAYALWVPVAMQSIMPLPDALIMPGVIAILYFLVRAMDGRFYWWGLAASTGALACYLRPNLILLPLFFPMVYVISKGWRSFGKGVLLMGVFAALFVVILFPWALRNHRLTGHWIFTSLGAGNTLWEGLGEIDNPWGAVCDDSVTKAWLAEKGIAWHSMEADNYTKALFLDAIQSHPKAYMKVLAYRVPNVLFPRQFWGIVYDSGTDVQSILAEKGKKDGLMYILRHHPGALLERFGNLCLQALDWLWLVLSIPAIFTVGRKRWPVIVLPCVYFISTSFIIHVEPRYILPAMITYFILGSVTLNSVWERCKNRSVEPS